MSPEAAGFKDNIETAARIAEVMSAWLEEEVRTSMTDHNSVLDDWDRFKAELDMPVEDQVITRKIESHHSRLKQFTAQFVDDPENDYLAARQLFCLQIHLSAGFRHQSFMQAQDRDDYLSRRQAPGGLGIDVQSVVLSQLQEPVPTLEDLVASTLAANTTILEAIGRISTDGKYHIGQEESPIIDELKDAQTIVLKAAVDHIRFIAHHRPNGMAGVPFLPAMSITRHPLPNEAVSYLFATSR